MFCYCVSGVARTNEMRLNVLLFNNTLQKTLSSTQYDLIVPNRIQLALQLSFVILNLFRAFFIQMRLTCVGYTFRFIFKFVLGSFIYDGGKKLSKFWTPSPNSLLFFQPQTSNFVLSRLHSQTPLTEIHTPSPA